MDSLRSATPQAIAEAEPKVFWLDDPAAPQPGEALTGQTSSDLAIVGGGFTGLWTAVLAKERDPGRRVVLLEGQRIGWAASGRNGGFCDASLTHGLRNGLERHPEEMTTIERLGRQNLDEIEEALERYSINCSFERTGRFRVATEPWHLEDLEGEKAAREQFGQHVEWLDRDAVQAEVHAPTYVGAIRVEQTAMLNPARLAWGLKAAALGLGVEIFENTPVTAIERGPSGVRLVTPNGSVNAERAALGTNAFPSPLRRVRAYLLPVYDYALATEPLSEEGRNSIGWRGREGIGDVGNRFHYYRLTDDDRIIFGGYDAIYHYGNAVRDELDQRPATFSRLAEHFFATFPQLEGTHFTHSWGGAIDTCSRFYPFWGRAYGGRVAYCAGYTGLGVAATRFGADVMLDLLNDADTERTRLEMVRTRPVPFPPEPLRTGVVSLTSWSLGRADRKGGRRNIWLRTLDRLGVGFNS